MVEDLASRIAGYMASTVTVRALLVSFLRQTISTSAVGIGIASLAESLRPGIILGQMNEWFYVVAFLVAVLCMVLPLPERRIHVIGRLFGCFPLIFLFVRFAFLRIEPYAFSGYAMVAAVALICLFASLTIAFPTIDPS